jgi:hypothetical protein
MDIKKLKKCPLRAIHNKGRMKWKMKNKYYTRHVFLVSVHKQQMDFKKKVLYWISLNTRKYYSVTECFEKKNL